MILRMKPSWFLGSLASLRQSGVRTAALFLFSVPGCILGWTQDSSPVPSGPSQLPSQVLNPPDAQTPVELQPGVLGQWQGLPVRSISFEGVDPSRLDPLPGHLPQAEGAPLNPDDVRRSLRRLFSTGLFEAIQVEGTPSKDGVALLFRGKPRTFIGTVGVDGAKGGAMNTQLARASQLSAGTRFTPGKLSEAVAEMRRTLEQNGFHEAQITYALTPHPEDQLVDIAFHVTNGPQSRIGAVQVTGEPGMSAEEFRRHAHLRAGAHVDHDTANRALAGVLKYYRNKDRLEAEIKLVSADYAAATKRTNFRFSANQGPPVKVLVQGANMSEERIRHVIPIYEEGTVDEDLLMEGNRRMRGLVTST